MRFSAIDQALNLSFSNKLLAIIIAILATIVSAPAAHAAEKDVVVIVVDGIGWHDWADSAGVNTERMLQNSAIALSNNRSAQEFDKASIYLTIGAGARSGVSGAASSRAGFAYSHGEKVDDVEASIIFERYTGIKPPPGSAFHLATPTIIEQNSKFDYGSVPGLLGQTMKEHGKKVAILGNADGDKPDHREAALIGMDSSGIIPWARLDSSLTKKDDLAPYGKVIDTHELNSLLPEALEKADLTIIDFGDTARAERARAFLLPEVLDKSRQQALRRLDYIIGKLIESGKERELLTIILTPSAGYNDSKEGRKLVPLIIHDSGKSGQMVLLESSSTRRQGIVLGTEIAPTILEFLNIPTPETMAGSPLRATSKPIDVRRLMDLEQRIADTSLARPAVLTAYITALIVFLGVILLIIIFAWQIKPRTVRIIKFAIAWLMSAPAVLLLVGAMPRPTTLNVFLVATTISLAIAGIIPKGEEKKLTGITAIMGITIIIITVDILSGQRLASGSVLGYDPIIGARFYGIGNELMGILVGTTVVVSAIVLELKTVKNRAYLWGVIAVLAIISLIIGYPKLGANFGGLITAVITFLIALAKFKGYKLTPQRIAAIIGATAMILLMLLFADSMLGDKSSHIGRVAEAIKLGNGSSLLLIMQRKIAINYKLLQWTVWSRVFIMSLAVYAILFMRPFGRMKDFVFKHKTLSQGIVSAVIGSIIAMLFNDSGVVCGATTIIFAVLTQLYVIIDTNQTDSMVNREAS